jgi:hypothetical protein
MRGVRGTDRSANHGRHFMQAATNGKSIGTSWREEVIRVDCLLSSSSVFCFLETDRSANYGCHSFRPYACLALRTPLYAGCDEWESDWNELEGRSCRESTVCSAPQATFLSLRRACISEEGV